MSESQEEHANLSRRDVLRHGLGIGLSSSALAACVLSKPDLSRIVPLCKERHLASCGDGIKIGVITTPHGDETFPELIIPIKEIDLYKPVGAYFPEAADDYFNPEIQRKIPELVRVESEKRGSFHQEPLNFAIRNGIPIIFGDFPSGRLDERSMSRLLSSSEVLVPAASFLGLINTISDIKLSKETSRRGFLKKALHTATKAAGSISSIGALHFASDDLIKVAHRLGAEPKSEKARDFASIFSDITHPEEFLVVLRNNVWALKCIDLYQSGEVSKNKIINVGGGFGHKFFTFFAKYPDFALEYWNFFNHREAAKVMGAGDSSWVNHSLILTPPNNIKVIHHKSMDSMVAKS